MARREQDKAAKRRYITKERGKGNGAERGNTARAVRSDRHSTAVTNVVESNLEGCV